jgi:hypothetical protein
VSFIDPNGLACYPQEDDRTPSLQFLDEQGKVIAEYPKEAR